MPRVKKWAKKRRNQSPATIGREIAVASSVSSISKIDGVLEHQLFHLDKNHLERSKTQWQFGDWESLAKLELAALQHHPDRAKLALLAAAGHLQQGDHSTARQYIGQAEEWGCSKELLTRILVSGIHNSLGKAQTIAGKESLAHEHFATSVEIGSPDTDKQLILSARLTSQIAQLNGPTMHEGRLSNTPLNKDTAIDRLQGKQNRFLGLSRFKKVVITGDLLRPTWDGGLSQTHNIKWLYTLLATQIACVFSSDIKGEKYVRLLAGDVDASREVYTASGRGFTEDAWAELYFSQPNVNLTSLLDKIYKVENDELIIAFELPEIVKQHFKLKGLVYVDIRIGQYRYFDDIPLAFSSNDPHIEAIIQRNQMPIELIEWYTKCVRMQRSRASVHIEDQSLVFFGQTSKDSSLILNGRFDSYKNHIKTIEDSAELYSHRYYKHHPYEISKDTEAVFVELGFKVTNENTYDLLTSDRVTCVMGITTTVLHEAKLFEKNTARLGQHDVYHATTLIYDAFLSANFWSDLLGLHKPCIAFIAPSRNDLVRSTIGAAWGK